MNPFAMATTTSTTPDKPFINYKVMILGDVGTGKSAFRSRVAHNVFSIHYKNTIGVDFSNLKIDYNDTLYNLQMWDIGGQEKFGNMMTVYTKESVGCFIFCDVTRTSTMEAAKKWLSMYRTFTDDRCPCYLLVSKMDLISHSDQVEQDKINSLGSDFDKVFMISSKDTTTYDITGKINPDIKLKDVIDQMLYDLIALPDDITNIESTYSKPIDQHIGEMRHAPYEKYNGYEKVAGLFDMDYMADKFNSAFDRSESPQTKVFISKKSNMYYVSERIRIKLTLAAFMTASDMKAKSCFNIVDYIIDKINYIVEDSGSMTYTYDCSTHNLNDKDSIETVIDEMRSKGYTCNHDKDNSRIIITWFK